MRASGKGYAEGLLRKLRGGATLCAGIGIPEDNTPAILHTRLVPGDKLTLTVAPKGLWQREHEPPENAHPCRQAGGHCRPGVAGDRPSWRAPTPVRRWCWAWALAETLSWWPMLAKEALLPQRVPAEPRPLLRPAGGKNASSRQRDRRGAPGLWGRDHGPGSAISRLIPPTLPGCLWLSMWGAMSPATRQWCCNSDLTTIYPSSYCNILDNVLQ